MFLEASYNITFQVKLYKILNCISEAFSLQSIQKRILNVQIHQQITNTRPYACNKRDILLLCQSQILCPEDKLRGKIKITFIAVRKICLQFIMMRECIMSLNFNKLIKKDICFQTRKRHIAPVSGYSWCKTNVVVSRIDIQTTVIEAISS